MKYMFSRKGFTLVEIMVVVAIVGIFTTIVIGATSSSRAQARDNKRIADIKAIQLGLALYYDVNRAYPAGSDIGVLSTTLVGAGAGYLPEIPTDPAGGNYEYLGSLTTYCLGTELEFATIPNDNVSCVSASSGSVANYKVKR